MRFKDAFEREMTWKEKLAAWALWRWATKGDGMLGRMLGNKATSTIAALIVFWVAICKAGVLPVEWCDTDTVIALLTSLGLLAAKDATTGSKP